MPAPPALLAGPEMAFVLLGLAVLGVVLEVAVPGLGVGALGALGLLGLAGWALTGTSPRPAGLLLTLLAAALLTVGVFVRTRLPWSIAGGLALLGAGAALFDGPLSVPVLLAVAVGVPVGAAILGDMVSRAWRSPPYRGTAGTLIGVDGEVREGGAAGERIRVHVAGALWHARSAVPLDAGARVVVTAQDDMELRVATHPREQERRDDGTE